MQEVDEEDDYSDDDLDALPVHAFHELQQKAIRSTQKASDHGKFSRITGKSPRVSADHAVGLGNVAATPENYPQQPSSDYGDFDDEMLDGEIIDAAEAPIAISALERGIARRPIGESTQREEFRQQRYAAPSSLQRSGRNQRLPQGRDAFGAYQKNGVRGETSDEPMLLANEEECRPTAETAQERATTVDRLQAQVQELLRERDTLKEAVNSANNMVLSKNGEISIVRANQIRLEKENEESILALQKLRADDAARHKLEVEKARAEQEKIATEKRFLENDLGQGVEKIKNLQKRVLEDRVGKTSYSNPEGVSSPITTPKKNKSLPYGDGFNRNEIKTTSPAKLSLRPKVVTPKAAGKRKRKVDDSPANSLVLSPPRIVDQLDDSVQDVGKKPSATHGQNPNEDKDNFKFTQKVINHRIKRDEKRSFESLAAFAYPSNPAQSLSTIFLDKLSELTFKTEIESFPAALGRIIVTLWSQCIDEKYYDPVNLLVDLVKFILLISPPGTGPLFPDDVVACTQWTADINVIKRFQRASASEIHPDIDTNLCLQILHLLAYDCLRKREDIERFWRSMRFDFIIMVLNVSQPIEDIHLAISLLRTSVLETSFAMRVTPGNGSQSMSQDHVIDQFSRLLVETPLTPKGAPPYEVTDIAELRIQVLGLLEAMCDNRHCGEALATHKDVIGRLVKVMNDELSALYDYQHGHEYRSQLVNASTRLLFHLTSNYTALIDMQAKLRLIPGGTHKYLIALTRLALSEGIFYEKGIEEDVADAAHQMLETLVNPQEAEALLEAFTSLRSSR